MPRSPVARILIYGVGIDLLFSSLVAYSYLAMMNIDGGTGVRTALGVFAVAWVLKVAAWTTVVAIRLRPLARWTAGARPPTDEATIREAAIIAYRAPLVVCVWWATIFAGMWMLVTLVLYFGFSDAVHLGPRSIEATVFTSLAIFCAGLVVAFLFVEWLLAPVVERASLIALERRIEIPGRGLSFRKRLVGLALMLAFAPTLYLSGVSYMNDARNGERALLHRAQNAVAEATLGNYDAAREAGGWVFTFGTDAANLDGREAARVLSERPALARELARAAAAAPSGTVGHPREGSVAFRARGAQRIGVVIPGAAQVSLSTMLAILVILVMVAAWAAMNAMFIAGSTAAAVVRISEALARVGGGAAEAAPRLPVFYQDEIGELAKTYNAMVDQLREFAHRATEVSKGALDVELGVRGELGDAFRGQLASLREMVGHIAHSASRLVGAASELYAAAQEQEQAAHQQSTGIEEVGRTMGALLVAATHVTRSTMGVLAKADRARETATRTAERITELSAHTVRIGRILEIIREIAGRSKVLALNAALEGIRAGNTGSGFTLVAAEMRKLTEQITASVQDIDEIVNDVRASVFATVSVTLESNKLAEGTAEAAHQINLVTQQQRSSTEQAENSMRDVASMIARSLAATQQVRALAENLKAQAAELTGRVARFRLPEPARSSPAPG